MNPALKRKYHLFGGENALKALGGLGDYGGYLSLLDINRRIAGKVFGWEWGELAVVKGDGRLVRVAQLVTETEPLSRIERAHVVSWWFTDDTRIGICRTRERLEISERQPTTDEIVERIEQLKAGGTAVLDGPHPELVARSSKWVTVEQNTLW